MEQMKKEWHYSRNDFFELVSIVRELIQEVHRLTETTKRQENQIEYLARLQKM